jgi:hypothetical protein
VNIKILDSESGDLISTCTNPIRSSYELLECTFNDLGGAGQCLNKNVTVTIAGLTSNSMKICYAANAQVQLPVDQKISEGSAYPYSLTLTRAPESAFVTVNITSSPLCLLSPTLVSFSPTNFSSGVTIYVSVANNDIDEGVDVVAFECIITHTVISSDVVYAHVTPNMFRISAINNDIADAKLQLPSGNGFEPYRLKVVGPLCVAEGTNASYALVLDTKPVANVSIYSSITDPRANTPLAVTLDPPFLLFDPLTWNIPRLVTLSASGDSVDNDEDIERFEVLHYVRTDDPVFQATALNNTVIAQVSDDDTAGIVLTGDDVLTLIEGGENKSFTIQRLSAEPLRAVNLTISSEGPLKIYPSRLVVTNWGKINATVKVSAKNDDYSGGTTSTWPRMFRWPHSRHASCCLLILKRKIWDSINT